MTFSPLSQVASSTAELEALDSSLSCLTSTPIARSWRSFPLFDTLIHNEDGLTFIVLIETKLGVSLYKAFFTGTPLSVLKRNQATLLRRGSFRLRI